MKPTREQQRKKRQRKLRTQLSGTAQRPRLVVSRSLNHVYAQLIDDTKGVVLASSSSLKLKETGVAAGKKVGEAVAKAALEKKVKNCVFDRAGYLYHGRVKAIAEGAREAGLKF